MNHNIVFGHNFIECVIKLKPLLKITFYIANANWFVFFVTNANLTFIYLE